MFRSKKHFCFPLYIILTFSRKLQVKIFRNAIFQRAWFLPKRLCYIKISLLFQYYNFDGMPTRNLEENICAVCGNKILIGTDEEGIIENTYKLSCSHSYPFFSSSIIIFLSTPEFVRNGFEHPYCRMGWSSKGFRFFFFFFLKKPECLFSRNVCNINTASEYCCANSFLPTNFYLTDDSIRNLTILLLNENFMIVLLQVLSTEYARVLACIGTTYILAGYEHQQM